MPKTIKIILYNISFFGFLFLTTFSFAQAACDCGSTDSANPCTGQSISVTVIAGTPNGGKADNSVYNWSFNSGGGDALCGQFANGDYWIAPATGQTTVTVTAIATTSPGPISADVDPEMESMGLLSSVKTYGNYNADENIIPRLPQSYNGINSLVAAVQRDEITSRQYDGNQSACTAAGYSWNATSLICSNGCGTAGIVGNCADSYNIVTILNTVPENAGATVIRPNITGETKEILTFSDFDFSRLPAKDFLTGGNADGYETVRQRWSHSTEIFGLHNSVGTAAGYCSEGGRAFRSHILVDDYGGGTARSFYSDMMTLFSDDNTLGEKTPALAAMLSYGLDLYHARYTGTGRDWGIGATQHPGKFIPAVFLAALLLDDTKAAVLSTASANLRSKIYSGPHELGQITIGVNGPVWGDYDDTTGGYWKEVLLHQCFNGGAKEYDTCSYIEGKRTGRDPYGYIDGPAMKPGIGYIASSLGGQRALVATMMLMPEIRSIVNYEALIDYVHRADTIGVAVANDPCVAPDTRESPTACDPYRNVGCEYYKKTWGPDPANPGQCIKTATPPYTQVGRFTSLAGTALTSAYASSQVEANWDAIMALYNDVIAPVSPSGLNVL